MLLDIKFETGTAVKRLDGKKNILSAEGTPSGKTVFSEKWQVHQMTPNDLER